VLYTPTILTNTIIFIDLFHAEIDHFTYFKRNPNKFNLDDFLERLIVIEKIDEGMEEAKAGKTVSHDKVKKMVAKWHK